MFGNTGSGKSCTVAGLLRWSIEAAAAEKNSVNARFIVIDPNGEYRTCFKDLSALLDVRVYSVEPKGDELRLTVPCWMWNGQEWSGALEAAPGTQRPVLMQALRRLRGAALAGDDPLEIEPIPKLLFAAQLRAFIDWLQACRAEGIGVMSNFQRLRTLHDNLAGFEDQLGEFSSSLTSSDTELSQVLETARHISLAVRERRSTNSGGRRFLNPLQDADLLEVIDLLQAVRRLLPDAAIAGGPSEDAPSPFDAHGLPGMIGFLAGMQPGNMQQHMAGMDLRLRTLLADTRIAPIIVPEGGGAALSEWLDGILGNGAAGRGQLTVLDLSLVPTDVLTTIVSVLARLVFEATQRYRRTHLLTLPVVLVLEEAHNFVQRHGPDTDETGPAVRCRQVFEKIAKEGRKFGVGLVLSSQRPAELSPTIVAQCNSFILHRIVNDRDQELVGRLAPDSSGTLLKELPSLPTQKAVLMGVAAEIPLIFDVRPLPEAQRPNSANPDFWSVWTGARPLEVDVEGLAGGWSS